MIRLPAGADGTLQGPAPIPYSATAAARQREAIAPVALKPAADYGTNAEDLFLASYRDPKAFGPGLLAKSSSTRPSHGSGRPESNDLLAASRESRIPPPAATRPEDSTAQGSEPSRSTVSARQEAGDAVESPFEQAQIPPPQVPQEPASEQARAAAAPAQAPPSAHSASEAMIPPPRQSGLTDSPDLQQASRETGIAPLTSPASTTEAAAPEPANSAELEGSDLPPTLETPPSQPTPVVETPTLPPTAVEDASSAEATSPPSAPATSAEPPGATEPSAPAEPPAAPPAGAELPAPTPVPSETPALPSAPAENPATTPPTEPSAPAELPPASPSSPPLAAAKEPSAAPELPSNLPAAEASAEQPMAPVERPAQSPPPAEEPAAPPASLELPSLPPAPAAMSPAEPPAVVPLPTEAPAATPDPLPPLDLSHEPGPDPKTKGAGDAFEEASIPPPTSAKPGSEPNAEAGDLSQAFEQAKIPPPAPLGAQSTRLPGETAPDPDSLPPLQLDAEVLGTTLEVPAPPPLPTPPPTVAVAEECPACLMLRKQKESDHWANGQAKPKVLCPGCKAKESQAGPSTKPGKANPDLNAALKEAGIAPPRASATGQPASQAGP